MSLRFHNRPARVRRSLFSGATIRLVSLLLGLGLVIVMMRGVRSPETHRKLELIFGEPASTPQIATADLPTEQQPADGSLGVDLESLETVEDNTVFRDEETEAWFHLFAIARDARPATLESASLGEVVYAQLLSQPEVYRGRVVSVRGLARRVEEVHPAANGLGINKLYRVILQPYRDGRRPMTLYCLELPDGWTTEELHDAAIRFTGFFFKNWLYENQVGIDLSPALIANSFTPIMEQPAAAPAAPALPAWQLIALAVLIATAMVVVVWAFSRVPQRPVAESDSAAVADSLGAIDDVRSAQPDQAAQ